MRRYSVVAINIQKLQSRRLEALFHDVSESFQQFVAQVVVVFTFCAQAFSIQSNGARQLDRPRIKMPKVRRNQPRPTEYLARTQRLHGDRSALRGKNFHRDFAVANDVKLIRLLAFAAEKLSGVEAHVRGAADDELQMMRIEALQKRVFG